MMSCYHPLVAIDLGFNEDGKRNIKVFPVDLAWPMMKYEHEVRSYYDVPCGHCVGCRQDQSLEWSNRLLMESLYHDSVYFITLTYCDEYVRNTIYVDDSTGEVRTKPTLCKKDFQDFMKRLRYKFSESKIRFYCAGEYGEDTDRPHYHAIIFGLPEDKLNLIPCGRSKTGNPYFRCKEIEDCWIATEDSDLPIGCNAQAANRGLNPSLIGFCSVEPANWYTMKYVTAYVTKKLGASPNQKYLDENRVPPFSLSSRKPGIGLQYLIDNPDIMEKDRIIIPTNNGKAEFKPPRYFKKKYAVIDPGLIDEISDKNKKKSEDRLAAELSKTDLNKDDYLKIKELDHLAKLKNRDKI